MQGCCLFLRGSHGARSAGSNQGKPAGGALPHHGQVSRSWHVSRGLVMTRVYRSRYDTCHVASSRYNIFQFLQFLAPLVIEEFYYFSDECYSDIKYKGGQAVTLSTAQVYRVTRLWLSRYCHLCNLSDGWADRADVIQGLETAAVGKNISCLLKIFHRGLWLYYL